jgi:hypothetical protein
MLQVQQEDLWNCNSIYVDSKDDSETFKEIINFKWKPEQAVLPSPLNTDEEDGWEENNNMKI